jgi:hypothetical protein
MTEPADKTPGSQGRVLFQRETRHEYVRLVDAIDEALAELQQQIREHLPDYMPGAKGGPRRMRRRRRRRAAGARRRAASRHSSRTTAPRNGGGSSRPARGGTTAGAWT